jgi:hypothetical protein
MRELLDGTGSGQVGDRAIQQCLVALDAPDECAEADEHQAMARGFLRRVETGTAARTTNLSHPEPVTDGERRPVEHGSTVVPTGHKCSS